MTRGERVIVIFFVVATALVSGSRLAPSKLGAICKAQQ